MSFPRVPARANVWFQGFLGVGLLEPPRREASHSAWRSFKKDGAETVRDSTRPERSSSITRIVLDDVFREVLDNLVKDVGARGAEIHIDRLLPPVQADSTTLKQVLSHLLANPAKFVGPPKAPRIRVGCQTTEGRMRIWVEDNGVGIARAHQRKIFGLLLPPKWRMGTPLTRSKIL